MRVLHDYHVILLVRLTLMPTSLLRYTCTQMFTNALKVYIHLKSTMKTDSKQLLQNFIHSSS